MNLKTRFSQRGNGKMQPAIQKPKNLILAWFVLIAGGLFLVPTLPYTLLLLLMPIWKPDEAGFFSTLLTAIPASICAATIWGMRRAYKTVRPAKTVQGPDELEEQLAQPVQAMPSFEKKLIWPWFVIVPSGLLMVAMGPGTMMLPIMPVYLAAMSTDSGSVPDYVPALIFVIGYALILGYAILLFKAIKALRAK
jgi:hypothetical protein